VITRSFRWSTQKVHGHDLKKREKNTDANDSPHERNQKANPELRACGGQHRQSQRYGAANDHRDYTASCRSHQQSCQQYHYGERSTQFALA